MHRVQCKMARAALGWRAKDLADAAEVGSATVARFELGQEISEQNLAKLKAALEGAGAQFTSRSGRIGVSLLEKP
jgi:transcriptional regulator with XRE-family HTH domain